MRTLQSVLSELKYIPFLDDFHPWKLFILQFPRHSLLVEFHFMLAWLSIKESIKGINVQISFSCIGPFSLELCPTTSSHLTSLNSDLSLHIIKSARPCFWVSFLLWSSLQVESQGRACLFSFMYQSTILPTVQNLKTSVLCIWSSLLAVYCQKVSLVPVILK